MTGPEIRPLTREDLAAYFPGMTKPTIRGYCGVLDGKIIGVGGVYFHGGRQIVFLDLKPEARRYKLTLVKVARRVIAEAVRSGARTLFTYCQAEEPMAERFLTSLGFTPVHGMRTLYKWQL